MKRMAQSSTDDEDDLWGESNGWHDSDGDASVGPLPPVDSEDVTMETWIIMELCNRGSLRVGALKRPAADSIIYL